MFFKKIPYSAVGKKKHFGGHPTWKYGLSMMPAGNLMEFAVNIKFTLSE